MHKLTFVFEVDGLRKEKEMEYPDIPSKRKVMDDMKDWFFYEYCMWFGVVEDGKEINLKDF